MTQNAPSILPYEQAQLLLQGLQDQFASGAIKTVEDVSDQLKDILTRYAYAGKPLTSWDPLKETEPALSQKLNITLLNMQADIRAIQHQIDISKAASLLTFNFITQEKEKQALANGRVRSKLKTLQMYSDSTDPSIIKFGNTFNTTDSHDDNLVPPSERASLLGGAASLGQTADVINLSTAATVTILSTSNGFMGNNQEVLAATDDNAGSDALSNPLTGEAIPTFVAETNRAGDIFTIQDGDPTTCFEYEHYKLEPADLNVGQYLNFEYLDDITNQRINWANGPTGDVLHLDLLFDLKSVKVVNHIIITPYGLRLNSNNPIKVTTIETSDNGTDWSGVSPASIVIGTDVNLFTLQAAQEVTFNDAVWTFGDRSIRYVRVKLEQNTPIPCNIGHVYYQDNSGLRVEGPIPNVSNPARAYLPSNYSSSGSISQKREVFIGKRWALGLRDISIEQINYNSESIIVSKPFFAPGAIDRISIDADISVPDTFSSTINWVSFYIAPNETDQWISIARIQDDGLGIPEIIAFNDPLPEAFRDPGVGYVDLDSEVTSLRVKIVLTRPDEFPYATPSIRSYTLKVKVR